MNRGQVLLTCGLLSLVFLGLASSGSGQSALDADLQALKSAGVPTDNEGLLQFFRTRTLKDADRAQMEDMVKKLDSAVYNERDKATKDLTLRGPSAVPFLKAGLKDAVLETKLRIDQILKKIESAQNAEVPSAAARVLAARNAAGGVEVLLNYLPFVSDEWSEEEVLTSLGELAVRGGKVDPLLTAALKDKLPGRRAAAVYLLARRGDLEQRELVRGFFQDDDALVRLRAVQGLLGKRLVPHYKDLEAGDETVLKSQAYKTDEPALLELLGKRTLGDEDQKRLRLLIEELGSGSFSVRNRASKLLVKEGTPALAFLKPALEHPDAEVVRRANLCIEEIRRGPGTALPTAAIRLLARPAPKDHSPAAAIRVLLAYAPFADDEIVEEEVFNALTILSVRESKIDPLLPEALHDALPARRAAAAFVLGRVGVKEYQAGLRKLLEDAVAGVRWRAAQGLIAAKDRTALPVLIALLKDVQVTSLWQIEETLHRLAGDKAPPENVAEATPEKRAIAAKAWDKWWTANGSNIDLARVTEAEAHLGLVTICEYDSAVGQPGGQVWEAARDGKPRWTIKGVQGAMDAQVLPNGRVLVTENSAQQVTERDLSGAVKWTYRTPGNPITAQRLPNGNTFIATYNQVMEITPDQKQVYMLQRNPQFYIFSARKLRNGNVIAMTAQGIIMEFDPTTNKDVRTINLGPNGGWCSVEALANGRYLVATMNNGQVREVDAAGKTHWTVTMPGAFRATRLPNGNTLVASMTTRLVAEYDRGGTKRWEKLCQGRPWSVRYR